MVTKRFSSLMFLCLALMVVIVVDFCVVFSLVSRSYTRSFDCHGTCQWPSSAYNVSSILFCVTRQSFHLFQTYFCHNFGWTLLPVLIVWSSPDTGF